METRFTLTSTWVKVLDANAGRRFLRMSPVTTLYDAYWSSDSTLLGTTTAGGFPVLAGEDFEMAGHAPQGVIYMRSAGGEVVSVREDG